MGHDRVNHMGNQVLWQEKESFALAEYKQIQTFTYLDQVGEIKPEI